MKVVFLEDVPSVGRAGDIKEVADGYGRNYLIPKRLAVLADAGATHLIEVQKKRRARLEAQTEEEMKELAGKLEGRDVVLEARAGAKDRLYGSITNADIAEELGRNSGLEIDKRKFELEEPIRETGSYEIPVRLTKDIVPKIKLVVREEAKPEAKEAKTKETRGKKGSKGEKAEKPKEPEKVEKEEPEEG
jgi:large subunit ribosomal protein L9